MSEKLEELISLLYQDRLTQYGKRLLVENIEKLQKENEELKNKLSLKQFDINVVYNDYLEKLNEYKENSIPVQKVKDKIEELKEKSGGNVFHIQQTINAEIRLLKELIEESEK